MSCHSQTGEEEEVEKTKPLVLMCGFFLMREMLSCFPQKCPHCCLLHQPTDHQNDPGIFFGSDLPEVKSEYRPAHRLPRRDILYQKSNLVVLLCLCRAQEKKKIHDL